MRLTKVVRPCTIPPVDLDGFMTLVGVDDEALAALVDRDRTTISRIRRRKTRPDAATLIRIQAWADRLATFAASVDWPAETGKRLTLSFHYRSASDVAAAEERLRAVADRAVEDGLRPRWGRCVLEIRPPIDADKGTAVRRLLEEGGLRRALYAGDDTTDLDAFRGLDGLDLAIRVAVVSDEAPDELAGAADLVVQGPEALAEVLSQL